MSVEDSTTCRFDRECDEVHCKMRDATMLEERGDTTRSSDMIAILTG